MKKAGTYIGSFIISVLLIFAIIGTAGFFTANKYKRADRLHKLAVSENEPAIIRSELEKYFTQNYNNTAIPPEVYMEIIDRPGFVETFLLTGIFEGYDALSGKNEGAGMQSNISAKMTDLDAAIAKYYSDYADSIGYEKDAKYDEKLSKAKQDAQKVIIDRCDIFKFGTLSNRGVLKKVTPIFKRLTLLLAAGMAGTAVLMLLMLLVNLREKRTALYWIGVSSLVAGILGSAPCIWLLATDYFSSFTVKQPQVYIAYTRAMTDATTQFMTTCITAAVIGIVLIIAYAVIDSSVKKKETAINTDTENATEIKTEIAE